MASFPFIFSFLILLLFLLKPNSALNKEDNKLVKNVKKTGGGGGVNATVRRELQSFAQSLMNILNETSTEEQVEEKGQIGGKEVANNALVDAENEEAGSLQQNKTRNRRQYYGYGYGYGGYGGYGYGYGGYDYGYGYNHRIICGILGCWHIRTNF